MNYDSNDEFYFGNGIVGSANRSSITQIKASVHPFEEVFIPSSFVLMMITKRFISRCRPSTTTVSVFRYQNLGSVDSWNLTAEILFPINHID